VSRAPRVNGSSSRPRSNSAPSNADPSAKRVCLRTWRMGRADRHATARGAGRSTKTRAAADRRAAVHRLRAQARWHGHGVRVVERRARALRHEMGETVRAVLEQCTRARRASSVQLRANTIARRRARALDVRGESAFAEARARSERQRALHAQRTRARNDRGSARASAAARRIADELFGAEIDAARAARSTSQAMPPRRRARSRRADPDDRARLMRTCQRRPRVRATTS
jgi:hypothetical protein